MILTGALITIREHGTVFFHPSIELLNSVDARPSAQEIDPRTFGPIHKCLTSRPLNRDVTVLMSYHFPLPSVSHPIWLNSIGHAFLLELWEWYLEGSH